MRKLIELGTWGSALALMTVVAVVSVTGTIYYMRTFTKERLFVTTTTSLFDTGLLDEIEVPFEEKYHIDLSFISVGTGQAIQHARRGDADMILVHAPSKEFPFLEDGYGVCRKIIAYNFFAIVGSETDPAKINMSSPTYALQKIVESGRLGDAKWVSRGDDSGTHTKEKSLWATAGFNWTSLKEESWFLEAGAGMGKTLLAAEEFSAYTLADVGTYLKYYKDGLIGLKDLVTEGEGLLNVYSAIAVNPSLHKDINFEGTITFIKFLISEDGQQVIKEYGKKQYGRSLFYPTVKLLKENINPTLVQWIKNYAFLEGYECPPEYQEGHEELYP
ncbi:MAG: substrate-binding domain-containing protein [Thermoproteota archaeon]|nr:substrate-binding domain-containing protein [Thermoproteota archaeon]